MSGARSVLIIGAGHAGGVLVRTLRDEGYDGCITLLGDERWLPYERPPLSKGLLLGRQSPADTMLHDAAWYKAAAITLGIGQPVAAIGAGFARLSDGSELAADTVVLATGASPRRMRVPGAHLANVVYLRSIDDALAIRGLLGAGRRIAIVGAGLLGLEAAAAARVAGADVTVIEAADGALRRVLPRIVADHVVGLHRARGVTFLFDTTVARFEGAKAVERLVLSNGATVASDLAIVAIGAVPNEALARNAGLAVDDGILVDQHCRTSLPSVYAVGDVTQHYNPWAGRRWRLESWQNAQNQARACAQVILGRRHAYAEVPWSWTDQYDTNVQFAGLLSDDLQLVRRGHEDGSFTILALQGRTLVGVVGVNRPRDVREARSLIGTRSRFHAEQLTDHRRPLHAALVA
ncbi:MAG: FAD-dependent oxidoreductase [Rhodospirillales bacterium]|nr:FAD-dependent oxidoreductase [Rhodospirillales bacterium]